MADHRVSKRFRSSGNTKEDQSHLTGNNLRKIRVICSDPEATDSSSDEAEAGERSSPRRIVCEIVIGVKPEQVHEAVERKDSPDQPQRKKLTGVRLRKWGKWAAEIRDPFSRKRIWLGTYNTAEEASKAYMAKKQEFQARLSAPTLPKSDYEPSTQICKEVDHSSTEGDEKVTVMSGRVDSPQDPIGKSSKVVHWKKWDRWGAKAYDSARKLREHSGTSDREEEAVDALQSMKLDFGSGYVAQGDSENRAPKIETLSLLSGGGGGETNSGTTTTTTTTTSMEDSGEEKGQLTQNVNTNEGNKPPWLGLGIGMLVIDNNGKLLGKFSRLDDDLRIC